MNYLDSISNYEDIKNEEYQKEEIGYKIDEVANPDDMLLYYSKEKIEKYGALAIRLEVID